MLYVVLALLMSALVTACGTVATPEWAADAQSTRVALAETASYETSIAPTATFTSTPVPTATPVPPTATATFTPEPTATPVPPTATEPPAATEALPAAADAESVLVAAVQAADPVLGQAAYQQMRTMPDGAQWACSMCHSVTPDQARLIGPGMWNVAVRGATYEGYTSGLDYIYTSIINPNEFIAPADASGAAYPAGLMPQHYGNPDILPPDELNAIMAYLLTLQD
ncbi:MAG: cytochrome c [bacterium]|nr:cytochrome c [bacterium]